MNDWEYFKIIKPYLQNEEVQKMIDIKHHLVNRLSHCLSVSYYSFLICKKIKWNYKAVAKAALFHDFYFTKIKDEDGIKDKIEEFANGHAEEAYLNAVKNFHLSPLEENIILSHMWPLSKYRPKYKEAIIVGLVDKLMTLFGH